MRINKSNQSKTNPQLSIVLLDWEVRDWFFALDWLERQDVPRDSYELIWVELRNRVVPEVLEKVDVHLTLNQQGKYHKHKGYNAGALHSRGSLLTVCDSDVVFPKEFVRSILDQFHPDSSLEARPLVLMHHEYRTASLYPGKLEHFDDLKTFEWRPLWFNVGACATFRRQDFLNFGGFDEHETLRGYLCGPYDLAWRLINAGIPQEWHDPKTALWHFNHPQPFQVGFKFSIFRWFKEVNHLHIDGHALTCVEGFSTGRVLPLLENSTIFRMRMNKRTIGSELEVRYSDMTGPVGFSRPARMKLWGKLQYQLVRSIFPLRTWARIVFNLVVKRFVGKLIKEIWGEEKLDEVRKSWRTWRKNVNASKSSN